MEAGAARGPVTALTGVRGPVVQTLPPLARVSVTDPLMTLLDIPTSLGDRNHGSPVRSLQHQVEYAAREAGVERKVVREPGEVVGLMAANIELAPHIEVGQLPGRQTGEVPEVRYIQALLPLHWSSSNITALSLVEDL